LLQGKYNKEVAEAKEKPQQNLNKTAYYIDSTR